MKKKISVCLVKISVLILLCDLCVSVVNNLICLFCSGYYFVGGVGEILGRDDIDTAFGENFSALLYFSAFEADNQRDVEADLFVGFDNGARDCGAAHDAAEDVYED